MSRRERLTELARPGIAVVADDVVSFEALQQRAARWGGALLRLGVRVGDTVVAVAVPSIDAIAAMAERVVENVLALLQGRDPGADYVLNPEVIGRR